MRYACACFSGGDSGAAGVSEQIQNFDGACGTPCIRRRGVLGNGILYNRRKPVPVRRLFRKQTGVLETERFKVEGQFFVPDTPFIRQVEKFPFAAAPGASVIMSVPFFPAGMFLWRIPDDLRVGPDEQVVPPAF